MRMFTLNSVAYSLILKFPNTFSNRTAFYLQNYNPQSRQSAKLFLQSSELGLPPPLARRHVCPPPPLVQGEGAPGTLAGVRGGWKSPNSGEGTYTVVLTLYNLFLLSIIMYDSSQRSSMCRWRRTGSTWPWCWTGSSSGSSAWLLWVSSAHAHCAIIFTLNV